LFGGARRGNFYTTLPELKRKMADSTRLRLRVYGPSVTVIGRVVRVRLRADGGWRVRLTDTGGALAAAEIRPSHLPPPRRGTRILLRGRICYDPDHDWYVVDPVDSWREAQE